MSRRTVSYQYLATSGTDWLNKAMTTATGTYRSDPIRIQYSRLNSGMMVKTSAGSLAITYEVSMDGDEWFEPYDTTGSGINSISADLDENRYIAFIAHPAKWIRFKFVLVGANSTVSAIFINQE